ncbi:MAG: GSCFA domain protein [Bacteroidia bacterium]|nr:GSCFA domain protein [Bacteroidia bacterium]
MDFRTIVQLPNNAPNINHKDSWLLLGSCFAQNIAKKASFYGFESLYPFGALYNPISIIRSINMLKGNVRLTDADLFLEREQWNSYNFHSDYSDIDKNVALCKMNECLDKGHRILESAKIIIITFGTAYIYHNNDTGEVVANCHHSAMSNFTRKLLTADEIVSSYQDILNKYSKKQFIFTVSPIRHLKDGAHANQLSKSTLLLAIDNICNTHKNCHYFPSYEIVLDELRDYRFYSDDMIHPSKITVDYVWERFSETYFNKETQNLNKKIEEIRLEEMHHPILPDSILHKQRTAVLKQKKDELIQKFPYIHW